MDKPLFDKLVDGFNRPPLTARPWVRWWWFGNSVTHDEIERELTFIARSGWGGVELQCVYAWPDVPPGPDLLSDAWLELVDYAATCAARHDLGFDLTFGSGWPFGGPHIPPDARAVTLRAVTCLASVVYTPEGCPARKRNSDRSPFASRVTLDPGEQLVTCRAAPVQWAGTPPLVDWDQAINVDPATALNLPGRDQTWVITAIVQTCTSQRVKRVAPGGEGYVHDHFSRRGLDAHVAGWGNSLQRGLGPRLGRELRALFCDSWEVYGPYWTADFLSEFQHRRDYDLAPYLPLLLGEWQLDPAQSEWLADLRYDYRRTVAELALENFYQPFADWCHEHGLLARIQAHGSPTNLLASYGAADIPETEAILIPIEATRLAASAARLRGRRLVTSESFTCLYGWPAVKMFAERPDDFKAIADGQFACGLQQVYYHGYAYSPPEAGETPGRHFYASSHVNHSIAWREHLSYLNDYVARVSWLMQQGEAVTDFALYLPVHDRWRDAEGSLGPAGAQVDMFQWPDAKQVPTPPAELDGYTFDWVDDEALARMTCCAPLQGQCASHHWATLNAQTYHAIVLDRVHCLPHAAAERLYALVCSGVPLIILGDSPQHVPGLIEKNQASAQLRDVFAQLLSQPGWPVYRSVSAYRAASGLIPDVTVESAVNLWWAHRHMDGADIYFVPHPNVTQLRYPLPYRDGSQRSDETRMLDLYFRVTGRTAQAWDAETGAMYALEAQDDGARTHVCLAFVPHQSHVIVFLPTDAVLTADKDRPFGAQSTSQPITDWTMTLPDGTTERSDLRDWRNDPRLRDFSGTLVYRATCELSHRVDPDGERNAPSGPVWVDLGLVEVVAQVWINGEQAGKRLWSPYRLRVDRWLRAGRNEIEVHVTNLLYNAVQGQRERAGGVRPMPGLQDNEWQEVVTLGLIDPITERRPSGLLGPTRLWFVKAQA